MKKSSARAAVDREIERQQSLPEDIRKAEDRGYERGVKAAASVADDYNSSTTHPYRLGDCVAGKLNVHKGKPRPNKRKLEDPQRALTRGMVLALASVHRLLIFGNDGPGIRRIANEAGITLKVAEESGAMEFDLIELRKAGVL